MVSALGEVCVLTLTWLGIENGNFNEGSYIHLSSKTHDKGNRIGRRNGYDLAFKHGRRKSHKQPIQVKTNHREGLENTYDPKIIIVTQVIYIQNILAT